MLSGTLLCDLYFFTANYAIPIFEVLYPGIIAIMVFDNSTNHGAMPEDGLNAAKMNVNSKGKQPQMRSTFFESDNVS